MDSVSFLGYSLSGESYTFEGARYPAEPDLFEHGVKFVEVAERL